MQALKERIQKLKKVILAHFYVDGSVQEIADYVGDSYYLSKKASESPCKTILFCGVEFMGESAKILNPEKTVIMADVEADCPMAHMVTPNDIKKVREAYDDLSVVCYINSTAQTKADSDVCVTSSNAERIVKALPQKNIFFIPDGNLGRNLAAKEFYLSYRILLCASRYHGLSCTRCHERISRCKGVGASGVQSGRGSFGRLCRKYFGNLRICNQK